MDRSKLLGQLELLSQHHQLMSDRNVTEVVDNLGGICAVVEFCLNSDDFCNQHMNQDNINNLTKILVPLTESVDNNGDQIKGVSDIPTILMNPNHPIQSINDYENDNIMYDVNPRDNLYFRHLSF